MISGTRWLVAGAAVLLLLAGIADTACAGASTTAPPSDAVEIQHLNDILERTHTVRQFRDEAKTFVDDSHRLEKHILTELRMVREQLQAQIEEIRKLEERLDNRVRDVEAGVMLLIGAGEDITAAARSSWKLPFSLLIVLAMGIALTAYYRWRKVTQW